MDILAAISTAKEVKELVNPETLGDALGTIELDAARDALRKAAMTEDRNAQLWSVINHLETTEVATTNAMENLYNRYVDWWTYETLSSKKAIILALMALIYKHLGELKACDDSLEKLSKIDALKKPIAFANSIHRLGDNLPDEKMKASTVGILRIVAGFPTFYTTLLINMTKIFCGYFGYELYPPIPTLDKSRISQIISKIRSL